MPPLMTALPKPAVGGRLPATLCPAAGKRLRRAPLCAAAWRFDDLTTSPADAPSLTAMSTVDQLWAEQMRAMERAQSEMAEMQRMMDQRFEAAQRDADALQRAGPVGSELRQERLVGPDGPCGYRWQRSEQQQGPGGAFRSYRSESFTVIGVPPGSCTAYAPPATAQLGGLAGAPLLAAAALVGFWAAAAARFHQHFQLTSYKDRHRWWMVLLWPLLLLLSSEFRQQFLAALRGRRAGPGGAEGVDGGDGFVPSS